MTVEEMKRKLLSEEETKKGKAWGGLNLGKVVYRDSDEWIISKTDKSKLHQKPYFLRDKNGKSSNN